MSILNLNDRSRSTTSTSPDGAFSTICCWPDCHARAAHEEMPLCMPHAWRVWRGMVHAYRPSPEPVRASAPRPGSVYFVQLGNRVKIGFSRDVRGRLTAIPHDTVLAVVPGTSMDERRCHVAFAHLREVGEWFRAEPDLLQFIADIAAPA